MSTIGLHPIQQYIEMQREKNMANVFISFLRTWTTHGSRNRIISIGSILKLPNIPPEDDTDDVYFVMSLRRNSQHKWTARISYAYAEDFDSYKTDDHIRIVATLPPQTSHMTWVGIKPVNNTLEWCPADDSLLVAEEPQLPKFAYCTDCGQETAFSELQPSDSGRPFHEMLCTNCTVHDNERSESPPPTKETTMNIENMVPQCVGNCKGRTKLTNIKDLPELGMKVRKGCKDRYYGVLKEYVSLNAAKVPPPANPRYIQHVVEGTDRTWFGGHRGFSRATIEFGCLGCFRKFIDTPAYHELLRSLS
ncbi:hypothetical protein BU16DRAFT_612350 [Lophium mytilinum]|uniref:Uncharacterized protein n=1 Tax=Lophium mytilinum TaxID=390894 RepID=A0A6A6RH08_9PEZI|nr:hypothetical protein BU16DRAFT_612350 [Lophium mytilinum]